MTSNEQLIQEFYQAFQNKNYKIMQNCYHPQAVFYDPVFRDLNAEQVQAMWEMLCKDAKDFSLTYSNVVADDVQGACDWQARYTFSRTGRPVENNIHASFKFKDGKIFVHRDQFDLWHWSRQALGFSGLLLGWLPFMQHKIHETARQRLDKFMQDNKDPLKSNKTDFKQ